jgi:predicted amidohydrolase YtcJ
MFGYRPPRLGGYTVIPGLTDAHIHWDKLPVPSCVNVFEVPDKSMLNALRRVRRPVGE